METWNELLQCNWTRIESGDEKSIDLSLPVDNCTDMMGCVQFCKAIMPEVQDIFVFAGSELDIVYRFVNDDWSAFRPK